MTLFIEFTDMIVKKALPSVTSVVRKEISSLIFKMLSGVVITSTLILSIFQLVLHYTTWLKHPQGNSLYPFLIFGTAITICIIALYFIFKTNEKNTSSEIAADTSSPFIIFSLGFLNGYNSKKRNQNNK